MHFETQYLDLLRTALTSGVRKSDRTGTGTRALFGYQMRFDLREQFPLLTTKKVHWKSVVHELLWFISGATNTRYLKANGVSIWDEWANSDGELGPVYGQQWRAWQDANGAPIDQLKQVISDIQRTPDSRRLIVSAWNVAQLPQMALAPCHCLFQFFVYDGHLSCQLYQRSADIFLGVPFNIASYALLTHLIAHACGLKAGEFIHTLGDAHLYENHLAQAQLQLTRSLLKPSRLQINAAASTDIDALRFDDITLLDYQAHPAIKAPIAI